MRFSFCPTTFRGVPVRLLRAVACLALLLGAAAEARAGAHPHHALPAEKVPAFCVPRISRPPTIDGAIGADEWREATAISGAGNLTDDVLIPRPTTFFFAWDPGHLYFAVRTYIKPNYKPKLAGRSPGLAYVWDDGLELHWQPLGGNVLGENKKNSYKWFLNCLGFTGDCSRLALGQQFKNWNPRFDIKTRLTDPGTAPEGGRWWELEMSSVPGDFELQGDNRAGDQWRVMLGINHLPTWMQARVACNGSYLDPFGFNVLTLVDDAPAIQMTMDDVHNLATDGRATLQVSAFNPTKQPATVTVDVNVADAIKKTETLAIAPGETARVKLDEPLPEAVKAGNVWVEVREAGKEQPRQLYRSTFNFKVGEFAWMTQPAAPPDPARFAFETRFNPVRSLLLVKADTYYLQDPAQARSLAYRVRREGQPADATPIAAGEVTRIADFFLQDVIQLPPLEPGKYVVEATMTLADGTTLGPMPGGFEKKDEPREFARWWGTKHGDIERVLPPYVAIGDWPPQAAGGGEAAGFSCLGRGYRIDGLGLPAAVESRGQAVLAAPARVIATIGGVETVIPVGKPTITERTDWRVRFEGAAEAAGLGLEATGWMEQDGLVYVELTYGPAAGGKPVRVDALRIEFPLAETDADCLLCVGPGANYSSRTTMLIPDGKAGPLWSTLDTGITGSGMALGSFYPTVWIGSERRGFLWWADNDKGWVQDDAVPAHDAVRRPLRAGADATTVVLRNHIVAKPTELAAPRTVAFSYMATPFKPLPQGFRNALTTEDGTFWVPFRGVRKDSKTGELVQPPIPGHVNWIHPESRYPEEWPAIWKEQKDQADAHARQWQWQDPYKARSGVNFTHMSFQIIGYGRKSLENATYDYFGSEWESQGGNDTWNDTYIDYAMSLFAPAFKDGGVRHTYWDLAFPILSGDLLSGLAYRLPDGRVQHGYNGWNVRRFMMRLWSLMHDAGITPGGNGFHSTNAYLTVAMPWADAVTDAERPFHIDSSPLDWVDNYPPERMRAMSIPESWGVAVAWMSMFEGADGGRKIDAARTQAQWVWMHDSWLNNWIVADHQPQLTTMPEPVLDWGVNAADTVYHPYWRNPFVACPDKDVLVSLWHTAADGHVALGVFNYGREGAKDAAIKVDLKALGLPAGRTIARPLFQADGGKAAFDASTGVLSITGLPSHKLIIVGLGAMPDEAERQRAEKAMPRWLAGGLPEPVADFGFARKETAHHAPGSAPGVKQGDEAIEVATWQLPDRVLLLVGNTAASGARDARLELDLDALGLVPRLPWQEFLRVRQLHAEAGAASPAFDYHARTLVLPGIPAQGGRLVVIRRY